MLSAAVKDEVSAFPDGLQRVPRRLGHGGHTRRHGCRNPIVAILTVLGPDFRTTVSVPSRDILKKTNTVESPVAVIEVPGVRGSVK
jgi:hypothetical protein